ARAQFLVLVPDIAETRALKVSAADSAFVADAIDTLARRLDPTGRRRVGLVAISYAVGPALLAAAQTPAGSHVGFVVAIGGYYDIAAAIGFVTTGYYRVPDGEWRYQESNNFVKWVFLRSNADGVSDPADRDQLRKIAQRRLENPMAAIDDLLAGLGAEGRDVYALITNRDPGRVPTLIARLPPAIREDLRRLNLKETTLAPLHGPFSLFQGRVAAITPYPKGKGLPPVPAPRPRLYVIDHFAHVDAAGTSLSDNLQLLSAATDILRERDR